MADRYYRRGHWVNKPRRKSKKKAGWLTAAVAAAVAWFAVQGVKAAPPEPVQPAPPAPAAPAGDAPAGVTAP